MTLKAWKNTLGVCSGEVLWKWKGEERGIKWLKLAVADPWRDSGGWSPAFLLKIITTEPLHYLTRFINYVFRLSSVSPKGHHLSYFHHLASVVVIVRRSHRPSSLTVFPLTLVDQMLLRVYSMIRTVCEQILMFIC